MKKFSLISLIILTAFAFYSCEENDNESGNDQTGNHEVYINGDLMNVTETLMEIDDGLAISELTIFTYCSDGVNNISFSIEPPSLETIAGIYEHKTGLSTYNLKYSDTKYSTLNTETGEREVFSSRLSSEVTVTNLGNDKYKFDLDLKFDVDENTIDTISGFYTATLQQ